MIPEILLKQFSTLCLDEPQQVAKKKIIDVLIYWNKYVELYLSESSLDWSIFRSHEFEAEISAAKTPFEAYNSLSMIHSFFVIFEI